MWCYLDGVGAKESGYTQAEHFRSIGFHGQLDVSSACRVYLVEVETSSCQRRSSSGLSGLHACMVIVE